MTSNQAAYFAADSPMKECGHCNEKLSGDLRMVGEPWLALIGLREGVQEIHLMSPTPLCQPTVQESLVLTKKKPTMLGSRNG